MADISTIKLPNGSVYDIRCAGCPRTGYGATLHNSIFRGSNIGSSISYDQQLSMFYGTFDNMYVGDYWDLGNNHNLYLVILGFNYFFNKGDVSVSGGWGIERSHHVVCAVISSTYSKSASYKMNSSNSTTGGYRTARTNTSSPYLGYALNQLYSSVSSGISHGVADSYYDSYSNAVTSGYPSAGAWYNCNAELMTEQQVFGTKIISPVNSGSASVWNYTISTMQFPYFAYTFDYTFAINGLCGSGNYWLRDVADASKFCYVDAAGRSNKANASNAKNIIPYVLIHGTGE